MELAETFDGAGGRWMPQDDVCRAVIQMERNGFALDVAYCNQAAQKARGDEEALLDSLYRWQQQVGHGGDRSESDALWSSPAQLIKLFHTELGLPPSPIKFKGRVNLGKGERSVDVRAVEWLIGHVRDNTVRRGLRELLELRKVRSSVKYLEKLPRFVGADGLIHPICGPAGDDDDRVGAVTWRLAMKSPEGQQMPKSKKKDRYGVRRAIVPRGTGRVLVSVDYMALEVVILAHLCRLLFNDDTLAESLAPGAPDFHSTNAKRVYGEYLGWAITQEGFPGVLPDVGTPVAELGLARFKCETDPTQEHPFAAWLRDQIKTVWYGLQYRKGGFGFGWSLLSPGGDPIGELVATDIVNALYRTVPSLQRYHAHVDRLVMEHGGVPGLNGCWCDLRDLVDSGDKWKIARAGRRAANYPMQQGGAAIIGPAMVNVLRNRNLQRMGYVLSLQVHDQLLGDVPAEHADEAAAIVSHEMINAFPELLVPLQVSATKGPNLLECR